jgi:hypothetical protein
MRQLVSVVADGSLRYYLHETGGPAVQVAQLVDPGVDVDSVIDIGVSLGSLYAKLPINGHDQVAEVEAPPVKAVKASKRALPSPPKEPPTVYADPSKLTTEAIVAYIGEHPGVRTSMIAADLLPGRVRPGGTKPRQSIDNRLRTLVAKHEAAGTEAPVHKRVLGPQHSAWYPGPAPAATESDDGDVSSPSVTEG